MKKWANDFNRYLIKEYKWMAMKAHKKMFSHQENAKLKLQIRYTYILTRMLRV